MSVVMSCGQVVLTRAEPKAGIHENMITAPEALVLVTASSRWQAEADLFDKVMLRSLQRA